jgi:hypothetical protein
MNPNLLDQMMELAVCSGAAASSLI